MQHPLPQASPTRPIPPVAQNQAIDTNVPDAGAAKRGWFPRWWLLSALFCCVLVGFVAVLLPVICSARASKAFLCQVNTWTDWQQGIIVGGIWLLFLIGWVIAHVFGVGTIEVSREYRGSIANILRTISEFETTYVLLYIYGVLAFWAIVIMWYLNRFQSAAFALCSLIVFVGSSCFLYRHSPSDRRLYLIGAAILSLFCIAVMFWIGPVQQDILAAEILFVLIAVVSLFRRIPNPPAQNPVQALAAARARAITPGQVFMALLRSVIRNRVARNQNNPNQPQGPQQWP